MGVAGAHGECRQALTLPFASSALKLSNKVHKDSKECLSTALSVSHRMPKSAPLDPIPASSPPCYTLLEDLAIYRDLESPILMNLVLVRDIPTQSMSHLPILSTSRAMDTLMLSEHYSLNPTSSCAI